MLPTLHMLHLLLMGCPRASGEPTASSDPSETLPHVDRIRRFEIGNVGVATLTESGVLEFHGIPEWESWVAERGPIADIWLGDGLCVRTAEGVSCKFEEAEFRVEPPTGAEVIDVDWSFKSLCAVTSDGALWCNFDLDPHVDPLRRFPMSRVRDIDLSWRYGCVRLDLDARGRGAQCWIDEDSFVTNLVEFCEDAAAQTPGCEGLSREHERWPAPIREWSLTRDIAVGEKYACVLDPDGVPRCLDEATLADLVHGRGDLAEIDGMPALVDIAAGERHVCGRSEHGEVWCWGDNAYGQLGVGTMTPGEASKPVEVSADELPAAQAIAVADHHACLVADGQIWCWGWLPWAPNDPIPTEIPGIVASELEVFDEGACARVATGWKCWGGSTFIKDAAELWKIVDVDRDAEPSREPVCIEESDGFVLEVECHTVDQSVVNRVPDSISLQGSSHYGCALTEFGEVHCWEKDGPVVRIELPGKQVAVSVWFREGCALDAVGGVRCWDRKGAPIVAGVADIVEVRGGLTVGCARDRAGTLACWGPSLVADPWLQTPLDEPVTIQLPAPAVQFGVGERHGCARLDDGRVFCWGDETNGQRARLSAEYASRPIEIEIEKP